MSAMRNPDQEWLDKIHAKGVLLFGAQYDKADMERRILQWRKKNPDITTRGVWSTIRYWFDITCHTTEGCGASFGIVPYVYDEAKQYFIDNRDMHRAYYTKDAMNECVSPDTIQINIKPPKYKAKTFLDGFQLS